MQLPSNVHSPAQIGQLRQGKVNVAFPRQRSWNVCHLELSLQSVETEEGVEEPGCMGGWLHGDRPVHLIKQSLGYAAGSALLSSSKGMFDHFGHREMVRCILTLHCSRHHREHGAFSKLLSSLQSDKRLFGKADRVPGSKQCSTHLCYNCTDVSEILPYTLLPLDVPVSINLVRKMIHRKSIT